MTEVQEVGLEEDCFTDKFLSHRRGEFVAFPVGVSFGGGQKVCLHLKLPGNMPNTHQKPGNLVHSAKRRRLAHKMKRNLGIIRIAGLQSSL